MLIFAEALRFTTLSVILLWGAVSARAGLSISYKAPAAVHGVQNYVVAVSIANTGSETIKVIHDPHSLISKAPTRKFTIRNHQRKGAQPVFSGIDVKYSPEVSARLGAFTTIAPGSSVSVTHNLSEAYNFTLSGIGEYEIEASTSFYILKDDEELELIRALVANYPSGTHSTKVDGALAVARSHSVSRRAQLSGCSASQQETLATAFTNALRISKDSLAHLQNLTSSSSDRYTTWFGNYTESHKLNIQSRFEDIVTSGFENWTYDCTSCKTRDMYAYVYYGESNFGRVWLCPYFWKIAAVGLDSQAGTLVHESSHFTPHGQTYDYVFGPPNAQQLAESRPEDAITNADNIEFFAESAPDV